MGYPKLRYIVEIVIVCVICTLSLNAQDDKRVTAEELKKTGTNYFNYSDPGKINIEINVLGGVRYPGRYLVPEGTNVIELLSLSGNILNEETADNIKLIRVTKKDGNLADKRIITLNYREMFEDEELLSINKPNPVLVHDDILVVPITPEKTFWDVTADAVVYVIGPLTSLAALIISIISLSK